MQKRTMTLTGLVLIVALALGACNNASTLRAMTNLAAELPAQAGNQVDLPADSSPSDLIAAYQGTLENIYQQVSPSVVNIRVVVKVDSTDLNNLQIPGFPFFNLPQDQAPSQQYQAGLGSGFVWDQTGHIVTNNHVVSGADKIEISFADGTIVPATLVGADPDSDLAVIKVEVAKELLQPVVMSDSSTVKVGQIAIAIGNPFGLQGTMTTGVISAVGRLLPADESAAISYSIPDVIQTDAPINPGNSGGVLVDVQGQVIGVTSAIESPVRANAGIGFAIPSAIVNNVVPALIKDGAFAHPWLGISGATLVPDLATAMDLEASQRGVLVVEILPNSPAEKSGLRGSEHAANIDGQSVQVGGDVIIAINDQPLDSMDELIAYLASSTQVGQHITLQILRDNKPQNVAVTLAARPTADERSQATQETETRGIRLGIQGMTMTEAIAREMNLARDQQGVLVVQVEKGSLAESAGMRAGKDAVTLDGMQVVIGGDVITAINNQQITSVQQLRTALAELSNNQEFQLTVLRDGKELQLTIQPGL